jgi:hypothetical protein
MPEFGGEGLDQLHDRISQLSERQATNARRVLEEIERQRAQAREQGRNFVAPDADQLMNKLQRANTPSFTFLAWSSSTGSPGTINLSVGVINPDPVAFGSLYVHLFIGPANLAADVGLALALVDARFPRLTLPDFFGLFLNPGDTATLDFDVAVPANIDPSNYLGNCFLFRADHFDVGDTLDRGLFIFQVT